MKLEGFENQSNYSTQILKVQSPQRTDIRSNEQSSDVRTRTVQTSQQLMDKERTNPHDISVSEKAIIDIIERANKAIQGVNTSFEYSIHEQTHQIMVKVLNRDTKEVIREIPPEKILDMVARMWEMAGIFVDEKR
ncbi:MAG: flagellar protein FlaG [Clostridia bacterium]